MTQIDFYLLAGDQASSRWDFACRLAETIWRKGYRLYIHVADESTARQLDEQLWSFKPEAFLPHGLLGQQPPSPVEIGWQEEPGDHHEVLLNLDLKVPGHFSRFKRVAEIIDASEAVKKPKRDDWKYYRDRGYPIQAHDMRR
ncbi:DNA polymerase III subunit chi [Marinospirillum perlucidum]|uniref:DNA polymerase III subunit chi n=1 Tax=Marinospirillum perlucidum TaxID=1982602 RepID=UPI000DF24480|nr:DNA polymerase III subunit chi [Marinospirillum perlucidum]